MSAMELIFDLETFNYHYVLIGAGALLFLLGIGLGVIISKSSQTARKSAHTKPKNNQKKATEPVKPKEATSSPAKLLHRIASTLLRSGTQDECMAEFKDCTIAARMGLYSILGMHTTKKSNMSIHWQHVFSNSIAQFWLGSSTTNGIKLRGEAVADSTPCEVVNLLLNQDVVTGLEGLGGKNEIISRTSTENQIMIVRKVYCKAGSGSFMSSKRDFKIITTIKLKKNGSYVIATRSGPWDYEHSEVGGSTNSSGGSSGPVCPNKVDLTKGFIRGIVHASGYVLTPIVTDGIPGCEISFGCHVDMKGTRSGRGNTANVNLILSLVLRTIKSIQNGDAEAFAHLEGQSLGYIERVGSWSKMFTGPASGQQASAVAVPLSLELEADAPESLRERSLSMGLPTQSPHLFNASTPSTADKYRLLSVARDAANRMRAQYLETLGPDTRGAPPRTSFSGPLESRRETIHDQDGIVIKEVIKDYLSNVGVISATFTVPAASDAVKKLLIYRPDSVDGFQEGRSILNYLNDDTCVQWMAYGALYPLVSKDFLLVTTHEALDKKTQEGFVIASTSIDDMCVLDRDRAGLDLLASSGSDRSQSRKFTRSYLRLAGYVGVPNADGTTELTFIVDLPADSEHKSIWLYRYLAQYCLTELAGRIRHALLPFHLGADPVDYLRRSASGTKLEESTDATADSSASTPVTSTASVSGLVGGGNNRTADLSRMLASIQQREEAVSKRGNNFDRAPVPHSHRNRAVSTPGDYFHPGDEPTPGRSRLDSDRSVGFSTWKEVRSRANSYIYPADDDVPDAPAEINRETYIIDDYRLPPHSPAGSPRGSGKYINSSGGGGIASMPRDSGKPQSNGTFAMLKRSLSKKKRTPPAVVSATRAKALSLSQPDSGYDSDSSRVNTPNSSPRPMSGKFIDPPSPMTLLRTSKATLGSMRKPSGDEVDIDSVQRELGRISPARRHSHTHARRRSLDPSEPTEKVALDMLESSESDAALAPAEDHTHGKRRLPAHPGAVRRSQSSIETSHLVAHPGTSHSMNDLSAEPQAENTFDLPRSAWRVYHKYFDTEKAFTELGIEWKLKLNKPNINIFSSMVNDNSWCAIKAVTVMNTTPMAMVKVLLDYDRMSEYDDMFKKSEMVQQVDSNTVIRRLCFKEVWPTAPRDFVVCASWQQNPDGSVLIVSRSVPDSFFAQEKPYVRGFLQVSGYLLEPYNADKPVELPLSCAKDGMLSPGECKVTLLNHTELGGTLPSSVINVLSTGAPLKILSSLSAIVSDKK